MLFLGISLCANVGLSFTLGSMWKWVEIIHCMRLYRDTFVSTRQSGCGGNVNLLELSLIEVKSFLEMNKPSVAVATSGL